MNIFVPQLFFPPFFLIFYLYPYSNFDLGGHILQLGYFRVSPSVLIFILFFGRYMLGNGTYLWHVTAKSRKFMFFFSLIVFFYTAAPNLHLQLAKTQKNVEWEDKGNRGEARELVVNSNY